MIQAVVALALAELGDVLTTFAALGRGYREAWGLSIPVESAGMGRWVALKLLTVAALALLAYLAMRLPAAGRIAVVTVILGIACFAFMVVGHNLTLLGWL